MGDFETKAVQCIMIEYTVTEREVFANGVVIEVQNDSTRFAWRLGVEGNFSSWTTHYQGLLEHKGYFVATAYWEGILPVFKPFRLMLPLALVREEKL